MFYLSYHVLILGSQTNSLLELEVFNVGTGGSFLSGAL